MGKEKEGWLVLPEFLSYAVIENLSSFGQRSNMPDIMNWKLKSF